MQTGKRAWWHRPCVGRAFQLNAPKQEGPAFPGLLWSQLSARPGLCCKADVYLWQGGQPGLRGKPTTPLVSEDSLGDPERAACVLTLHVPSVKLLGRQLQGLVSQAPLPPAHRSRFSAPTRLWLNALRSSIRCLRWPWTPRGMNCP